MKIRIRKNQIRFRISHADVEELLAKKVIGCVFELSFFKLDFSVQLYLGPDCTLVSPKINELVFFVPENRFRELTERAPSREGLIFIIPEFDTEKCIFLEIDYKKSISHIQV
ncbi:MAG: hypothetical protein WCJ92_06745 [Alphaproteobacteria bacterium]